MFDLTQVSTSSLGCAQTTQTRWCMHGALKYSLVRKKY